MVSLLNVAAPAEELDEVIAGNSQFAWNLYKQLKDQDGNLFFSPYSISTALAMTYAGARGDTAAQMAQVLRFPFGQEALNPVFRQLQEQVAGFGEKDAVVLRTGNSLWYDDTLNILPEFSDVCQRYYGSDVSASDFLKQTEESRQRINAWVSDKTLERIPELLRAGDITPETALVLTNAIYFKGNWLSQFEEDKTRDGHFWISDQEQVMAPMMSQRGDFEYTEDERAQVLSLPYVGEEVFFVVVLPKEKNGLSTLEAQLEHETVMTWIRTLHPQKVAMALPKFTSRSRCDLLETLEAMGMEDLSDFSGMSPEPLQLSKIIHEAFVDVNEHGTEAAASTAVVMGRSMPRFVDFTADHPFLFLIVDKSANILFLGRVSNPLP